MRSVRLARPGSTSRRVRALLVIAGAVAAAVGAPALGEVFDPPPAGVLIATDASSSFVGAELTSGAPATVEVWRHGVRIAHTASLTPDALPGGVFGLEINHELGPVKSCWAKTTPVIERGDSVRVLQAGNEYRSTVRSLSVESPALDPADLTGRRVFLDFRALDVNGTTALPLAELETLIRNTSLGGGAPRWLAPGASPTHTATIGDDPTEANPSFRRATYEFATALDATNAVNADIVEASWLGGGEASFVAFGATPGPAPVETGGFCPAPLAFGPLGVEMTKATDTGVSDTDGLTADATPTFNGLVAPNAPVNLYIDVRPPAAPTTTLLADANGVFNYTPPVPLPEGAHLLRTADATGGGETFAIVNYGFVIDTVAPSTTITATPDARTRNLTPTFGFVANEPGAAFECSLVQTGAPVFSGCASPLTAGPLALGAWAFTVRAADPAGNVGAPVASAFTMLRPHGAPVLRTKKAVVKNGHFTVLARCDGPAIATCSGRLEVVRITPPTGAGPARTIRIASAVITLRAGQTRKVGLTLTKAARARLAANGRISARVRFTPTGGIVSSYPLTLTPSP